MKKALKDVWRSSGGDIGQLAVTGKSGGEGHPYPKPGKPRKPLSKRNASPINRQVRIAGMGEPQDKSEPMSSAMREEIRKYAEDPQE